MRQPSAHSTCSQSAHSPRSMPPPTAQLRKAWLSNWIDHYRSSRYFLQKFGLILDISLFQNSYNDQFGHLSLSKFPYLAMATESEDNWNSKFRYRRTTSDSMKSTGSIDSGYESLNYASSHRSQDYILGLAHTAYEAAPSDSANRVKKHSATFQCNFCVRRYTRAYDLRRHLRNHTDGRPFVCIVCEEEFAHQLDQKRHEELHLRINKFVCEGKLKEDGQWGCGRRFARADALGRHFLSETGRLCIKPLWDEEGSERHDHRQDDQRTKHDLLKNEELGSADLVDISRNCDFPAALLAQHPALAKISWIKLSAVDDGYDGGPSRRTSKDTEDSEDYSDTDADYIALQPSIKEGNPEEAAAVSPLKEPDTETGGDCAAKNCELSLPKESTNARIEPSITPQINESGQLVFDNKASFSSSTASSNDKIGIRSKLLDNPAKPRIGVLAQVSEQADEPTREPSSTDKHKRTENLSRGQVSDNYDCLRAVYTTESEFEDNESSENDTLSSEASSESSFISQILEAYKMEAVESLMTEFMALLDHELGVRSRTTSTGSSTSSSPPPSSAEQPSQRCGDERDKRKERDEDGSESSREGGDDDQYKKPHVEGPLRDFSPRKFACPYYRRNSQKHKKHRSCAGPGWVSVHRVK